MPRRLWPLAFVLLGAVAGCGQSHATGTVAHRPAVAPGHEARSATAARSPAAATASAFSRADVKAMARDMAARWPAVQRSSGTYPDFADDSPSVPDTRYGDAFMGYALVSLGLRTGDDKLVDSGLRGVGYSVRHWAPDRTNITQSVFENWAVPATYNLARTRLAGNRIFRKERKRWEDWLRISRAERSGNTFEYGNHWLVDASGVLETLATGLSSSKHDAVLGGQRLAARAGVLSLVNQRVPRLAPPGKGPFLFSDPPDNPLAYEGLSLGFYAHLIRSLGPNASKLTGDVLRRAADALWLDTAPDGDSAWYGRSQEMIWGAAGTAYGALVAANLPGTSASAAARYRALADRSFARLRDAYPILTGGQVFVPALAVNVKATIPWLDGYAGAPSMDGIALLLLERSLDEMKASAKSSHIAADRSLARAIGSGAGRIAMVRRGAVWFGVRLRPTSHRHHVGDLRYDSGLAIAKHLGGDGAWHDVVPVRPTTAAPGFDSAGPDVLSGSRVSGVPVGDTFKTSTGKVAVRGAIRSRSGGSLGPLRASYVATSCGVELMFAAHPVMTYEYSAFFRGRKLPSRSGGRLEGSGQTVTASPEPVSVALQKGYGSAGDPRLVRARMRFRVSKARTVHVTLC